MTSLSVLLVFVVSFYFIIKYKTKTLIYLIIFLIPFRFEIFSIGGIGIRITDILSLLYITLWIIKLMFGQIRKFDIKLLSPILFFLIVVIVSFLVNAFRFSTIVNLVDLNRLILAMITGIAISTSLKEKLNFIKVFKIWMVSATLSSAISMFIFFSNGYGISTLLSLNDLSVIEFYSIKFSNSLFFEDPNNLASYLLISIFITLGLCLDNYIPYKYKYLCLSVQFFGLVLTLSRSAYIAAGIAAILFLFSYKIKDLRWLLIKLVVIFIIAINAVPYIESLSSDTSAMSRLGLWQVGLNMTLSNPLLVVGVGNSSSFFIDYVSSSLLLYNPHFHNLFLTISSEIGLIGFVSFVTICLKHLYKWTQSNDKLYVCLCLALISYLFQSFGVEYFASRHFWIFIPLIILYKTFSGKGGDPNGVSISTSTSI